VAYLEVQVMLSRLLLDWRIQYSEGLHWSNVRSAVETTVVPVFPEKIQFIPTE
jgi:hypothetical protein